MNKIIALFKKMDRVDRMTIIFSLLIFIFLCVNIASSLIHMNDYNKSKNSGSERWVQVETILKGYEERINILESKIESFEIKQGGN